MTIAIDMPAGLAGAFILCVSAIILVWILNRKG